MPPASATAPKAESCYLARAVAAANPPRHLFICRDGPRMAQLARALAFFAPQTEITNPAWTVCPTIAFAAFRSGRAA